MTQRQQCRSCGHPIIWSKHETTGGSAPIDANPRVDGDIRFLPDGRYYKLSPLELLEEDAGDRHANHFSSCPDAARWRGPK